ncbi:MAG: hypothetical protein GX139_02325 [Armatimonadetes bacterium]|nr:hypothetical protein [Armatimonadota bacterium]
MSTDFCAIACCLILAASTVSGAEKLLYQFDAIPSGISHNNSATSIVSTDRGNAMEIEFHVADWPNIFVRPTQGMWDWSEAAGFAVDVYNPQDTIIDVSVRVDNPGADGISFCTYGNAKAAPKAWTTLSLYFTKSAPALWGMRGIPNVGTLAKPIDLSKVTAFQVYLSHPEVKRKLIISRARLLEGEYKAGGDVKQPFVDRYGQYKHAKWPGKLTKESQFAESDVAEQADIKANPAPKDWDTYGGLLDGPQLEATGWFRAQKLDGRWWLVTPEGRLFFSMGMDCVQPSQHTFVTQREKWFDWLPKDDDPEFGRFYGQIGSTHSMADIIGGKGKAVSFYEINLVRKYGKDWFAKWRDNTYSRLNSWGFNTIANWSHADVMQNSPMPFTACAHISALGRSIEGGSGYWGRMADVYDSRFAESVDKTIAPIARLYASNRYLLGYFVDNELSWESIDWGALASPPDQPCRIVFMDQLKKKYSTLEAVNKAWGTHAASWDDLRAPANPTKDSGADLSEFSYNFAHKYFDTVKSAIRKYDRNHLYLGVRFSGSAPEPVAKACADVADVVSYNIYSTELKCSKWPLNGSLDAPIIIGEFHFGALDRGMFHTGLVDAKSQKGRAESFIKYVRSALDCPSMVGVAWFQYIDQAITGRTLDGENYNIGFVTVVDQPYPELVSAARKVNAEIYKRHLRSK